MRIAVIGTISSSMVNFRGPLLKALVDAGNEVFAFAIDYDDCTEAQVRRLGANPVSYRMDRAGNNPLSDIGSALGLARRLKKCRIDLILSYFMKPVVYGTFAGILSGVKLRYAMLPGLGYAFTETQQQRTKQKLLRGLLVRLLRFALAHNERLILYNRDDIEEVYRYKLVREDKVVRVNGTGIDLNHYLACPPVTEPLTFMLAARLLVEKGIREYAEAARIIRQRHPAVRIVLLGGLEGSAWALQRDEVEQWVEDGVLEWPGHVQDVGSWLEQASVYVLPSYYREGVPRSSQEAMAIGRPIITTDSPGCRETVENGVNGFLVPVREPEKLAAAMCRFIENPELVVNMGAASRQLAEERYDVHKINKELLRILGVRSS